MTSDDYKNGLLTDLRESKNLTQQNVADAIKVSRFTVIRAEQGVSASWKLLQNLASYYGTTISELLIKEKPTG